MPAMTAMCCPRMRCSLDRPPGRWRALDAYQGRWVFPQRNTCGFGVSQKHQGPSRGGSGLGIVGVSAFQVAPSGAITDTQKCTHASEGRCVEGRSMGCRYLRHPSHLGHGWRTAAVDRQGMRDRIRPAQIQTARARRVRPGNRPSIDQPSRHTLQLRHTSS